MHERANDNGLQFPDLAIQGFRGIRDLSVSNLGRVTLVTGKNNIGKSSVLEALSLLANNAAPHIVYGILAFREEYIRGADDEVLSSDPDNLFQVSSLFHGFPPAFGRLRINCHCIQRQSTPYEAEDDS